MSKTLPPLLLTTSRRFDDGNTKLIIDQFYPSSLRRTTHSGFRFQAELTKMSSTLLKFYVALFLTAYLPISLSLYEYICTEKGLYTPYMNIYQGRSGAKIFQAGPGFYDMRDHYDIYICINGP